MNDWTAGYVADIAYTYGYYSELNPLRLRLAFLNAGLAAPEVRTACELGFGQGMSINIHAAASGVQWYGTDFNPAHAGFAQELARASGTEARLYDQGFLEFCNRSDLPDFDFIGLHGIWSWISDENRAVIVDFLRRKLKVGGVAYISYNTLPGWAAFAPVRHLLSKHVEIMGVEGNGLVHRVDGALDFAEKLLATNPRYGGTDSHVGRRLDYFKKQNRHYLVHEFFSQHWNPMYFSTVAELLSEAKLTFACSANYQEQCDGMNLTTEQREFLNEIPDPVFRETVRDFMLNRQFRRDYWVKGARTLKQSERVTEIRKQKVVLTVSPSTLASSVSDMYVEPFKENLAPLIDALSDFKPRTLGELEQLSIGTDITIWKIVTAVMLLVGRRQLAALQDEETTAQARSRTDKLNAHLMNKAHCNDDLRHLASPATGGGVALPRIPQLFLLATTQGKTEAMELARFVCDTIASSGNQLILEGKRLKSAEEAMEVLISDAKNFIETRLPMLKSLQLV